MVSPLGEDLSAVSLRESGSGQPGRRVPLSVGLEVATAVQPLVNETQQLDSIWGGRHTDQLLLTPTDSHSGDFCLKQSTSPLQARPLLILWVL